MGTRSALPWSYFTKRLGKGTSFIYEGGFHVNVVGVLCVGVRVWTDLWEGLMESTSFWLLSSFILLSIRYVRYLMAV